MKDGRIAGMDEDAMPFDAKRMIYGGFPDRGQGLSGVAGESARPRSDGALADG
jgi:hypothetical protein